jgi:hypothetical protein
LGPTVTTNATQFESPSAVPATGLAYPSVTGSCTRHAGSGSDGDTTPVTNYTDVPTFQRHLVDYQLSLHRTMMLAVAGASTGIVGALVFSGGAITFGVARHRARRVRPRVTLSFVPDRRRPQATLTLRF